SDGDLFAPGNPVESPGEMGLRLEGASSFHAASRPRRRAFSLRRRVLGRRGSGHRAGWYIWSTDAPERRRGRWRAAGRSGGAGGRGKGWRRKGGGAVGGQGGVRWGAGGAFSEGYPLYTTGLHPDHAGSLS